ncbi:MAG: adenine phosphoribosyltransferase [Chaenotheca gracillima]|nr:MAG: adenine phosphoribosyltransferase [Chaenotheca gracillima]
MKFLKHIRSKSKLKEDDSRGYEYPTGPARYRESLAGHPHLPEIVLDTIFSYVCLHTQDESWEPPEKSMVADGCMLCDTRDLAQCTLVCKKWHAPAQKLLYHSIRIDAVHYCEREIILAEKRKRRSFFDRNADPKDAPTQRLRLLSRTLRLCPRLAIQVQYLKMPYMTRETCKADLARTVSVLPNLQYVDLPEGFFSNDASCSTLAQELQVRCPEIKKMKYIPGSEGSFTMLAQRRHWQALQELEISSLTLEPSSFVEVLGSLPELHHVKLSDLPWLDDSVFSLPNPSFPPLQSLSLTNVPAVTINGLMTYLSNPINAEILSSLTLSGTGIATTDLHHLLPHAPYLTYLSFTETVSRPFPHQENLPSLSSESLQTLYFEVISSNEGASHSLHPPAESHYAYLCTSLHAATLPNLLALYVRDISFPEMLVSTASNQNRRQPGGGRLHQPASLLTIYTKGPEELAWNFTSIPPSSPPRRQSQFPSSPAYSHGHSKSMNAMPRGSFAGAQSHQSFSPSYSSNSLAPPDMSPPRFPGSGGGQRNTLMPGNVGGFGQNDNGLLRPSSSAASSGLAPPPPLNWGGRDARRSVVMGNGAGMFLAVPDEDEVDRRGSYR